MFQVRLAPLLFHFEILPFFLERLLHISIHLSSRPLQIGVVKCPSIVYTNHLCINIKKQDNVIKKTNIINKKSKKFICSLKNCNEKSYIKFNCFHCNKHYCLKHKYTDLHECKKI